MYVKLAPSAFDTVSERVSNPVCKKSYSNNNQTLLVSGLMLSKFDKNG